MLKSIRSDTWASLLSCGEAKKRIPVCKRTGDPAAVLRSTVSATTDVYGMIGYRMVGSRCAVNQGSRAGVRKAFKVASDPKSYPEGDRALVVVRKRGNSRGAKGGRKLTMKRVEPEFKQTDVVPERAVRVRANASPERRSASDPTLCNGACMPELPERGHICVGSDIERRKARVSHSATGEPDAGNPPVRFGGRGGDEPSLPLLP